MTTERERDTAHEEETRKNGSSRDVATEASMITGKRAKEFSLNVESKKTEKRMEEEKVEETANAMEEANRSWRTSKEKETMENRGKRMQSAAKALFFLGLALRLAENRKTTYQTAQKQEAGAGPLRRARRG